MGKHKGKIKRDMLKTVVNGKAYTTAQAAQRIGVTTQTMVNWCNNGTVANYRIGTGGHRRIRNEDIQRLIAENVFVFEPKKTVYVPGSVIPMIDNQIRINSQYSLNARKDNDIKASKEFDYIIEGLNISRRIVEKAITHKDLEKYKDEGVEYDL
jgi:excisionase family DNA binding protein